MSNFSIQFAYPLLLLLLIPAFFFSFFPYFRMAKKYRRTRNHIVSLVLHTTAMVLCVFVLSGISLNYETVNTDNEIFLLVDVSYSGKETQEKKDEFIESVLDNGNSEYKIGIITFGYGQTYVAEPSTNTKKTYDSYRDSLKENKPDDSATDIASAISFARKHIKYPKTTKIVVLSDGMETESDDKILLEEIRAAAAEGIRVDTVSFANSEREYEEVQIIGVELPDYNVTVDSEVKFGVTLQNSIEQEVEISLSDNGADGEKTRFSLDAGIQTVEITHVFTEQELHSLSFKISSIADEVKENNEYNAYIYMEVFDKVLVVESIPGESNHLKTLLEKEYTVDVLNVAEADSFPKSSEEIRLYDQVVLVNIAHSDMPDGFEELLNVYVKDFGGGLFTVGGSEAGSNDAHAYNRDDLFGTTYQDMLPVLAQDYTPPLGVVIIIDCSGSMDKVLEDAKAGARACLNAMTERDYCGVMALNDDYQEKLALTPVTREYEITAAIDSIEINGGTLLTPSLSRAGDALKAQTNIEKKHIIVVSDCMFADNIETYGPVIESNYAAGITLSIVGINTSADSEAAAKKAVELGNDEKDWEKRYHSAANSGDLSSIMREDLNVPSIKEVSPEEFTPTIRIHNSIVSGVKQQDMPKLGGYYGTKAKDGADVVLAGKYVPIYAQWKYGKGNVGSFMCDLSGKWSQEFLASEAGNRIVKNIIAALFPEKSIRAQDIIATLTEKNYGNTLNVYTHMEENERIEVEIKGPESVEAQIIKPTKEQGYTQIPFTVTVPGVYEIVVRKKDVENKDVSECTLYKAFSYSEEYNMFVEEEEEKAALALITEMASTGNGHLITEGYKVFEGFVKRLPHTFDPYLILMIISLVFFLLDVAVRKFKFKWIHEIIRDRKEKKELEKTENIKV